MIAAANFTYLISITLPSVAVWLLRRDAVRGRFERAGVPVAVWNDDSSFAVAMEEVDAFRRHARTAPV